METVTIRCYNAATNEYYDKEIPYEYDIAKGKEDKLAELETYIVGLGEEGIVYKEQEFRCDAECEQNLISQITVMSVVVPKSIIWFSKTQPNQLTVDEFKELAALLSAKRQEIKIAYYTYKNLIEQSTSEEDLNNISFKGKDVVEGSEVEEDV